VHEINTVNNHAVPFPIEFLIKLAELIDFLLLVKVSDMKLMRKNFDEAVILRQEGVPVSEVTDPQTKPKRFACISWSNATFCRTNYLISAFLFTFSL